MPTLKYNVIENHHQLFEKSCVPSSIELILKLENVVDSSYYELQRDTGNTPVGGINFDNKSYPQIFPIITFNQKFKTRGNDFPYEDLFNVINEELNNGRYVVVTLQPDGINYHNYILFDYCHDNEYAAITRFFDASHPSWEFKVKEKIRQMHGTDILVYQKEGRKEFVDKVLKSATPKKIVVAGPGTGKTFLFKKIVEGKNKTLTLTFVNSLVEDLSLELNGLSEVKTLHSFARSFLQKTVNKEIKIYPKLVKVINEDAKVLIGEDLDFNKIFNERDDNNDFIEFYKNRRTYYDKIFGYSDLIYNTVRYLELHKEKIPSFDQIVVDEFQDFNKLEVSLIDLLAITSPIMIAGDDDQAIYDFKSANPDYIRNRYGEQSPDYENFSLPFCSRCTKVIIDAVNDLVDNAKRQGFLEKRISKQFTYHKDKNKDVINKIYPKIGFSQIQTTQIPWFISKQVEKIANEIKTKFSVLVISPAATMSIQIKKGLIKKGFMNVDYQSKQEKEVSLLDGLKILLEQEKSNLGWRIVLRCLLSEEEFKSVLLESDKDHTKLLNNLIRKEVKQEVKQMLKVLKNVKRDVPLDESNLSFLNKIKYNPYEPINDLLKSELISEANECVSSAVKKIPIKLTSIESSKGLAADYVFITNFDDQLFIKDKNKNITDQDICKFLVALTRARNKVFLVSSPNGKPTFMRWINEDKIETIA